MKKFVFCVILAISAIFILSGFKNKFNRNHFAKVKVDTLSGLFLYEINVPFNCYSRFDQIEQGNSLIYFSDDISKKNITEVYKKGIFTYSPTEAIINKALKEGFNTVSKSENIWKFVRQTAPYIYEKDSINSKSLIYDISGNLTYIKIYAKIAVENLGPTKVLIPKTDGYQCCFSNSSTEVETYLILNFIDFRIYK
jgi:hypothetical protein